MVRGHFWANGARPPTIIQFIFTRCFSDELSDLLASYLLSDSGIQQNLSETKAEKLNNDIWVWFMSVQTPVSWSQHVSKFCIVSKGFIEAIAVLALWGIVSGERRSGEKKTTR